MYTYDSERPFYTYDSERPHLHACQCTFAITLLQMNVHIYTYESERPYLHL